MAARRAAVALLAVASCYSAPGFLSSTLLGVHGQPSGSDAAAARAAESHLERGNGYYGGGNLDRAASEYEACLERVKRNPLQGCLINLGSVLVDLAAAGAERGDGNNGGEANNLLLLLSRAEDLYRRALSYDPNDGDASFNLALLLQETKTDAAQRESAALYGVAVEADPDRWDAWANMASALSEIRSEPLRAANAYERAILLIEGGTENTEEGGRDPTWDKYLSVLYYGYGIQLADLTPEACRVLAEAPQSMLIGKERVVASSSSSEAAAAAAGDGESSEGAAAEDAADAADIADLCAENAQNALRAATDLDPSNAQAAHMLAAVEAERGGSSSNLRRATPEFVAALFDDFADTFDAKLGSLGYKVPGLVGRAAAEVLASDERGAAKEGRKYESALDAGCGTGLAGRYLRPLVDGPLIGVDISRKMLDVAGRCTTKAGCGLDAAGMGDDHGGGSGGDHDEAAPQPLYDGLMPLDLETMTIEQTLGAPGVTRRKEGDGGTEQQHQQGFDLIVAADVLVYFGNLDALLSNFAALSSPESALIFSCERATDEEGGAEGWRLLASGRFAHTKAYVLEAAKSAGYGRLVGYEEIVPRMEKGEEVQGHLFRFVKGGDEGRGSDGGGEKEEL